MPFEVTHQRPAPHWPFITLLGLWAISVAVWPIGELGLQGSESGLILLLNIAISIPILYVDALDANATGEHTARPRNVLLVVFLLGYIWTMPLYLFGRGVSKVWPAR